MKISAIVRAKMPARRFSPIGLLLITISFHCVAVAGDLNGALESLRAVGPKGAGNEAASVAWQEVAQADVSQVPKLLAALNGANPLAANWIRTAVDTVCERALRDQGTLPKEALEKFVLETQQDPKGRRLAYEWLLKVAPEAEERIIPRLLDDPSVELRRDAVEMVIEQGEKAAKAGNKAEATTLLKQAFDAARDRDQIGSLTNQLKQLGHEVDLVKHDGLIVDWLVVGPFDNTDEAGFNRVYGPEEDFDAKAEYQGKHGTVTWLKGSSEDPQGAVDLYKILKDKLAKEEEREVVAYAVAEFHSPVGRKVQIRSSSYNAIKIWLNGRLVDEHDVYHGGSEYDQYQADAELIPGLNRIMIKVCQNAQTQSWTNHLAFQLRVCDAIGSGILSEK